ncbi:MAG TPA: heavy-metal-associated domain-containing protein [Kofleriaceae bacterium]
MKPAVLAAALAVALGACDRDPKPAKPEPAASVAKQPAKPPSEPPRPAQLTRVTIKALGMYCEESCPLKVRYALADVTAVYELGFDVANESIFVSYDASLGPAKQVTKPMIAAIKTAGFDPWLSKEEWPADAKTQVVLR